MRILLSTTSYQDTPGPHHDVLAGAGYEVIRDRGPLNEAAMLALIAKHGGFDGLLNGDDALTAKVIDAALAAPTPLRVIAKYGIGLDSVDVEHATLRKLPVLFTPGVNHTTVAEHTFGLMICLSKRFWPHLRDAKAGKWTRITGNELYGKTLAVLGLGRIGKEVIKRADAFGMKCVAYNRSWDDAFAREYEVQRCATADEALQLADVASLHLPLSPETRGLVDAAQIARMRDGALIVNTGRGAVVVEEDIAAACRSGKLGGYGTDVLEDEPMKTPHVFQTIDNIIVTPHIGSRTHESVQRQAMRATQNLINFLNGSPDFIQANEF